MPSASDAIFTAASRRNENWNSVTLEAAPLPPPRPCFGCLAGKIQFAPDFDAPIEDLS